MIEKDLDKVLNYMKQYVENKYEHNSEPMLTWKDLKLVLNEIDRLNNIINEANKILSNILVVNDWEHKGKYRPIKNTTSQEVYKSVCMLYGILKTPYRSDCGSLQELKGSGSNE